MIVIPAENHETFLKSIGFDQINHVEYVTVDCYDHRITWYGLYGGDDENCIYSVKLVENAIKWYRDGKLHRDGNLPAIVCDNSHQKWWFYNKFTEMK